MAARMSSPASFPRARGFGGVLAAKRHAVCTKHNENPAVLSLVASQMSASPLALPKELSPDIWKLIIWGRDGKQCQAGQL